MSPCFQMTRRAAWPTSAIKSTSGHGPPVGPFTVSGDGWHSVRYTAVDGAGNDAAVGTALVKIDATPPSSTLSVSGTVGGLGWYSTPASVSLSASDGIIGVVSV